METTVGPNSEIFRPYTNDTSRKENRLIPFPRLDSRGIGAPAYGSRDSISL